MNNVTTIDKKETLKNWVQKHSDELYNWALHKTSQREIAEDLVQETFLAAVKAFEKFKGKSSPKTWLFSILNNKIIDHYRQSAKTNTLFKSVTEEQATSNSDSFFTNNGKWDNFQSHAIWEEETHLLDNQDFNKILAACIENLPLKWQLAIIAKYIDGKSGKEICKELDLSASNYWQVIHRAKLLLRKCLEKNWED